MNEIEILRRQSTLERSHVDAVTRALDAAIASASANPASSHEPSTIAACEACAEYLVSVCPRVLAQDRAHVAELLPRLDASDARFQSLLEGLSRTIAPREGAVLELAQVLAARRERRSDDTALFDACMAYVRAALDVAQTPASLTADAASRLAPLFARHYGVAEWRRTSQTTADSIATERRLFRRVESAIPGGIAVYVSASA